MSLPGYYSRLVLSFICLVICATYGVIASIVLRLAGHPGLSQWTVARAFKWTMRFAVGVEFDVINEEHLSTRPAVFIGNHQTELDILMLGVIFPPYCSVTSKKQLKYVPFLGWFMALSKTVFIDRANRESAIAAFDGAARQMREERQSVYIFPEGTRSYTAKPEMAKFKKGAFHLAVQAQVPVVPVVVANYSHIFHYQTKTFTSGVIPIKVLPPVETKGLKPSDVDALTQRVEEDMKRELVALSLLASTPEGMKIASPSASPAGKQAATTTAASFGAQKTRARRT